MDPGTARPTHADARYVKTSFGILSLREFAPRLAERVAEAELEISNRTLADMPVLDLLRELHRRICADLAPEMRGRWRLQDVQVGSHHAPPHWEVPMLMHNFAADLEARMASTNPDSGDRILDDLAFAEGRLLFIHPFEDFNGRVSRLFLAELLYRLDLPMVDIAASSAEETKRYFAALQAYDQHDSRPLTAIWRQRISRGIQQ